MSKIMPSDILDEVYRIIAKARKGKGKYPQWLTAYQILARLAPKLRRQLEKQRCPAGKRGGKPYSAGSVVADACEMLANENPPRAEITYLDTSGSRFIIGGRTVEPSEVVCGIYRKFDARRTY